MTLPNRTHQTAVRQGDSHHHQVLETFSVRMLISGVHFLAASCVYTRVCVCALSAVIAMMSGTTVPFSYWIHGAPVTDAGLKRKQFVIIRDFFQCLLIRGPHKGAEPAASHPACTRRNNKRVVPFLLNIYMRRAAGELFFFSSFVAQWTHLSARSKDRT